jgi:hypothetical protein
MIDITKLDENQFIGYSIAEISAIPFHKIVSSTIEEANMQNLMTVTRILSLFHREFQHAQTYLEVIWVTNPVFNQTYHAQVRMFFVLRAIGISESELSLMIDKYMKSIINRLEELNFEIEQFSNIDQNDEFFSLLKEVDNTLIYSLGKNEKAVNSGFSPSGFIYYNDVISVTESNNSVTLLNTLTKHPNALVSIQIMPINYTPEEIVSIEETRGLLNVMANNMKYTQGKSIDYATQSVLDAYDYYSLSTNEPKFLFNVLVYGKKESTNDIANKLIEQIEDSKSGVGSAIELFDLSNFDIRPEKFFHQSPWLLSGLILNHARPKDFWSLKNAPVHLIRFKQIFSLREIRNLLSFPIDDGRAIGTEIKKSISVREKLDSSIVSDINFKIGLIQNTSFSHSKQDIHAGILLNDFTKHGLIVGMPGSGKTFFSLGILLQFWKQFNIPFLAIEPTKNEYRVLIDEIPDLQIFTPGKNNISPYFINPFIPPKGITIETYIPNLITAFEAAFSLVSPLTEIFHAVINECYNEYGWKLDSTVESENVEMFGLFEFIRIFKSKMQKLNYKGELKSNIESAGVVRLISLIEQNSFIYDTVNNIDIEELLRKPTIIELNAINNKEQKQLIMALLLVNISVFTKNKVALDGKLKNVILIDEAHVLLSSDSKSVGDESKKTSTIESIENLIAEIRSYGTSIIIADQSPEKLGRSIISNTNIKVIFKLVEKFNKDMISAALNLTEMEYDQMAKLGMGEAIVHHGRLDNPILIKTYDISQKYNIKKFISDENIANLSNFWNERQELLIPHVECKYSSECQKECIFKIRIEGEYLASKLINSDFHKIKDFSEFSRYLMFIHERIYEFSNHDVVLMKNLKAMNCIKIKFIRKALLLNDFGLKRSDLKKILSDRKYLPKREGYE